MRLYKYRGFSNIEFALDIFVNNRLYAAKFQDLNDPREGRFVYSRNDFDRFQLQQIRGEKARYKILSLSETYSNMLMWSYYAEGHKGFVVGVEICDQNVEIERVKYVDKLRIDKSDDNFAKSALTKKLQLWKHEKECRVLKRNNDFVKVEIKELLFGIHADQRKKELLEKIARKFCPQISIRTLERGALKTGNAEGYGI